MTYRDDVHPAYPHLRRDIAASPTTFVLLPSLDLETCVAETVRRQLGRPFGRSAEREAQVIRARFALHRDLPATSIETMRPIAEVVEAIVASMAVHRGAALDASRKGVDLVSAGACAFQIPESHTGSTESTVN
jgi:hypothetical protein